MLRHHRYPFTIVHVSLTLLFLIIIFISVEINISLLFWINYVSLVFATMKSSVFQKRNDPRHRQMLWLLKAKNHDADIQCCYFATKMQFSCFSELYSILYFANEINLGMRYMGVLRISHIQTYNQWIILFTLVFALHSFLWMVGIIRNSDLIFGIIFQISMAND